LGKLLCSSSVFSAQSAVEFLQCKPCAKGAHEPTPVGGRWKTNYYVIRGSLLLKPERLMEISRWCKPPVTHAKMYQAPAGAPDGVASLPSHRFSGFHDGGRNGQERNESEVFLSILLKQNEERRFPGGEGNGISMSNFEGLSRCGFNAHRLAFSN
jgi:hypothetical protein